jgi:protein-disulfide isomerase
VSVSLARRTALIGGLALLAGPAAAAKPAGGVASSLPGDMSLGSRKAKIHLVEYASLSCPHCARFETEVFPAFKAKYVDTGKVRYTLRELLTPPVEVAAAGFLMARCAGPDKYFKVVDEVFRSQSRWSEGDLRPILLAVAHANGLSDEAFDACISDPKGLAALNARVKRALDAGVQSTPTFFINGKKAGEGEMTLADLDAAIAAARKPGG